MGYGRAEMSAPSPWTPPHALLLLSLAAACGSPPAGTGESGGSETGTGDGTTTAAPTTGATGVITSATDTDTDTGETPTTGGDPTTGGTGPEPPDLQCPGDPSGLCDDDPAAKLEAGAAVQSIVPNCFETWVDLDNNFAYKKGNDELHDCGCDRVCPGDPNYVAADEGEGDGKLQASWMAGFGNGRPAAGVRGAGIGLVGDDDGLWARGTVLRQGNTTVAIVALDLVGWFNPDVMAVREMLKEKGLEVDHLVVHSTHTHEGPDTMGLWGEELFVSGYDPKYRIQLRETVVAVIEAAIADARPVAALKVGEVDISTYHDNGVANVISDHRDPWVVDEFISAAQLVDGEGVSIATLVNFGCHPETLGDENLLMTSDFVHALRRTVELGSTWNTAPGTPGLGGPVIYLNGAVGGMMTTLGVEVTNPDGDTYKSASWEKADSIGQLLGEMALDAIANADEISAPNLRVVNKLFRVPVVNSSFKFLFMQGTIEREVFEDPRTMVQEIETEMSLIELGPIHMLTVPGELLPELAVGGYDGSRINAPGVPLNAEDNPNPPDVANAPKGPYIKDRMSSTYRWIIGLANDELGYIIPEYDFQLGAPQPWVDEADGDHYEETNSLGPNMASIIEKNADLLMHWLKPE